MNRADTFLVHSRALWWLTAANAAAACLIGYGYVLAAHLEPGSLGWAFVLAALIGQIMAICLAAGLLLLGFLRLTGRPGAVAAAAALCFTFLQVFLLVDCGMYRLFHFHFNGLVWNVLTTPGGWESMHIETRDVALFILAVAVLLAAEAVLAVKLARRPQAPPSRPWRRWAALAAVAAAVGAGERALYAYSDLFGVNEVTRSAKVVPFYQPFTVKRLARKVAGIQVDRGPRVRIPTASLLAYPRAPLRSADPAKRWNVVWIVLDSWRSDMFSAENTPNLWALGKRAQVFERHFSGGNATRFGIFSMLYGVYGSYWQNFLGDRRGPVLIDRLKGLGYRLKVFSSTTLSFPEFRKTAFVELPEAAIADELPGAGPAEKDAAMVPELSAFLDEAKGGPFFAFLFADSSHGPYSFPASYGRWKPYLGQLSYLKLDVVRQRREIFNSYRNSVYWSDALAGRMLKDLERRGLMKDTVVIVTGDHGEEFLEYGSYGHNGSFSPAQVRVPLIVFVPGKAPKRHDRLTSHHDLPPTLLGMLGVLNPASDYSQGRPLFGPDKNPFVVSCSWDRCALIDDEGAVVFGTEIYNVAGVEARGPDYRELPDPKAVLSRRSRQLVDLMKDMSAFSR